jgi:NADH-quinone oxidoreductase subunit J
MFYVFGGAAIISATLMITDRNPVYAALWFAVTTLSVCGLFLLNSAPFLAAATVIVYAGAIIVTFLFVIMLAQQAGATNCDQHSYQPAAATVAAFLLLGCLMFTLQTWGRLDDANSPVIADGPETAARTKFARSSESGRANPFSQPIADDLGSLRNVGRSLFTDYLYAVELAGTVLLIATIGAIAIAPRRSQGTF